jgi:hypothetical protein
LPALCVACVSLLQELGFQVLSLWGGGEYLVLMGGLGYQVLWGGWGVPATLVQKFLRVVKPVIPGVSLIRCTHLTH